MGETLGNLVNNHVHDIVVELEQPKTSSGIKTHIGSIVGFILLMNTSNSVSMDHILPT